MAAKANTNARYHDLKAMLEDKRRSVLNDVRDRVRDARAEAAVAATRGGAGDLPEVETDEDLEFALIQFRAELAVKIGDALARLEEGEYGTCHECGSEIPDKRLRALPFAIRCRDCQEAVESAERRERHLAARGRSTEIWSSR
jgi:DnaK suppressor protein